LATLRRSYPEHSVVINAARTKTSTSSYGGIMEGALLELQRELIAFWIINRHRDSLELLHSFRQALEVVPNGWTISSSFLACLFPYQAAFKKLSR
jgi:hypothetical protein